MQLVFYRVYFIKMCDKLLPFSRHFSSVFLWPEHLAFQFVAPAVLSFDAAARRQIRVLPVGFCCEEDRHSLSAQRHSHPSTFCNDNPGPQKHCQVLCQIVPVLFSALCLVVAWLDTCTSAEFCWQWSLSGSTQGRYLLLESSRFCLSVFTFPLF